MPDTELQGLAESMGQAFTDIAPLLHPEVAQFIGTLAGQVLWLAKEVERLKAMRLIDGADRG